MGQIPADAPICVYTYMSGSSEKLPIAPQNLQSGECRSDKHPCAHLPTLAFLESLGSDLDVPELEIYIFNYGVGIKMQKSIFRKRCNWGRQKAHLGVQRRTLFVTPPMFPTPPGRCFSEALAPALPIKKNDTKKVEVSSHD